MTPLLVGLEVQHIVRKIKNQIKTLEEAVAYVIDSKACRISSAQQIRGNSRGLKMGQGKGVGTGLSVPYATHGHR